MAEMGVVKVRVELDRSWPDQEFYCPCALGCHRSANPCSFGCVAHDYAALQRIIRPEGDVP